MERLGLKLNDLAQARSGAGVAGNSIQQQLLVVVMVPGLSTITEEWTAGLANKTITTS